MKRLVAGLTAAGALLTVVPVALSGHDTEGGGLPVLINTKFRVIIPSGGEPPTQTKGKVIAGSFLGERRFCRGGKVVGTIEGEPPNHTVTETFRCKGGTLTIEFGPRSPNFEDRNQSGLWTVVEGTGRFSDLEPGHGSLFTRFSKGSPSARATYTGTVANSG